MSKEHSPGREPQEQRPDSASREQRAAAFNPKRGRSGYGMESIRPHLRAQIEQQKLLHPTFPPEDPDEQPRARKTGH